jgi:NADH-quinone oxidoreductase subunit N
MFLLMAGASKGNYVFIGIAALNMIISLYYYLRVVRLVFTSAEKDVASLQVSRPVLFGLGICIAGIIFSGVISWIYDHIQSLV